MQKGISSIFGLVLIVFIIIGIFSVFIIIPKYQTAQYKSKSQLILQSVDGEFESFKKDNYLARKNIKLQIADAKAALRIHIEDFSKTETSIEKMKTQYSQIQKPASEKLIDVQFETLFTDIEALFSDYNQDLEFRDGEFKALGSLPDEIETFQKMFYSGGARVDFILETEKISQLAIQTQYALKNLDRPEFEQEEYSYRSDLVNDLKMTFSSLNEDYRLSDDTKLRSDAAGLSARSDQRTTDYEAITDEFFTDSKISKEVQKVDTDISQLGLDFTKK